MFKNFVSLLPIAALISAAQITDTLAGPATLMAIKKSSRSPMKSSKSNTIIPVATKKFSLRHPRYDISATLRSLSEQPFDFTMHYSEHRESTYVMDNRRKNVAKHLSGACLMPRQFMQIIET